jgi:mersacidin/lichenicidin family type 2 lantibiotic
MNKIDVVRAWRDEEYRSSLTPEQLANLPESPAGLATVDDLALRSITGAATTMPVRFCTTVAASCTKPGQQCP